MLNAKRRHHNSEARSILRRNQRDGSLAIVDGDELVLRRCNRSLDAKLPLLRLKADECQHRARVYAAERTLLRPSLQCDLDQRAICWFFATRACVAVQRPRHNTIPARTIRSSRSCPQIQSAGG